jgi:mono/diheme cytochrome c family protein
VRVKLKHLGLLALFLAGFGLVAATTAIRHGFSARDKPSALEAMVATFVRSLAVPSHAKALVNPVSNTPENLAQAKAHWADHCASCHANNGSGDTVIGRNLYPKAPDMRLAATQNQTDGELYYTIENGVRLTGMPAWGEGGDRDEDSWKLVLFIRYLPKLSAQEEQLMEQMNPKSAQDRAEDQEEEKFLHGGQAPPVNDQPQKHHH